ncbi:MAG: DUF3783 domain-containing protein [Dorea sp.]
MKSIVLCYNLKGTAKGKKISMIFGFLGYKIRHVEKQEYLMPIQEVLAKADEVENVDIYGVEGFSEEMLVIGADTEDKLDKALFLMKQEKVSVPLKAVITQTNQEWNSIALHDEILREHKEMTKQKG